MKSIAKKLFAVLLTLAMCAALAVPTLAAGNLSSYDFFKSQGSKKAMEILDNSKFKTYTHRGEANDATNLQNMYAALDAIDKTNEYRAAEGLPALKVSDTYMAMAQVNANASSRTMNHTMEFVNQYSVLDCLYWSSNKRPAPAASDSWYAEKNGSGEKGHYETMMGRNSGINSTVTGAAECISTGSSFPFCVNETFGTDQFNEKTYTVAQYRDRLAAYMQQNGISLPA